MFLKLQLAMLALLFQTVHLQARDPKLDALGAKVAAQDKQIMELRSELQLSRQGVQNRIDTATSGLEVQKAALEAKLDQIREQELTAQNAINTRDQTIRTLNTQLDQLRTHAADTSTVAIAAATSAVKNAAIVATTRHAADSVQLKTTAALVSHAADDAGKAAKLGDENAAKLKTALGDIHTLTGVMEKQSKADAHAQKLVTIIGALTVFEFAILLMMGVAFIQARIRWLQGNRIRTTGQKTTGHDAG